LVVLLIAGFTMPVLAQTGAAELFGGYSLERIAAGCGSDYRCGSNDDIGATANLNGWITLFTGDVYKSLGVSAQFSGNYGGVGSGGGGGLSTAHRYAYQFGPAYTFRWQRASAFAHVLFGGVSQGIGQASINGQAPSYTAFLWSVGGGLDFKLSRRLSIRAAQIDYERHNVPVEGGDSQSESSTSPTNGLRYSAGVVVRF
jgi:peptidoglycan-associated lipoprotein